MSNSYNIFAKVTVISVLVSLQTDRGQIPEWWQFLSAVLSNTDVKPLRVPPHMLNA